MDIWILLFIQEHIRRPILDEIMILITHSGDYGILCIAACLVLLLIPKMRRLGAAIALSLIIEAIVTNVLIKNIVARTRPYEVIEELILMIEKQPDFSFPSGHAGITFAFAGVFLFSVIFGIRVGTDRARFKAVTAVVMAYAVVLAFSRLYVGVHYPTDVIGGIALGLISALAAYFLEDKLHSAFSRKKKA